MKSMDHDIKPDPADDLRDKTLLLVTTSPSVAKLKQSRYEDVWPEDVHAAFMEAAALYPPMGKRRLKYYRVSTGQSNISSDTIRAKSFGRCQLIQSYILEKTGKNRSRKQVSSHLQRLKKIHKDNPALRPLFSECPRPSQAPAIPAPSQDIFTNLSISTRHLKSDFDLTLNLQNTDTSTISYASETSSSNTNSCNAIGLSADNQPSYCSRFPPSSPLSQPYAAGSLYPADNWDRLSELQSPMYGGSRASSASNTSALSISMRRFTSRRSLSSMSSRHVDLGHPTHLSRFHSPGFQSIRPWVSHGGPIDDTSLFNSPITPAQDLSHTPFYPPQLSEPDKQRLGPDFAAPDWPRNHDISLGARDDTFDGICLRYPPAMHQYNPMYPEMLGRSPASGSRGSLAEDEESQLRRGISYSYTFTSPAIVSENVLNGDAVNFAGQAVPESPESLVSPFVIRPTPTYPNSYTHCRQAAAPSFL